MRRVLKISCFFAMLAFLSLNAASQSRSSVIERKIITDFEQRAKRYADLRQLLGKRLPKLSVDATPEQIQANKIGLQKSVQAARRRSKAGELFTPAAARLIRDSIKNEFKGWERAELRQTVLEADTKGVPLKINIPYPESKELVEMSPTLLLSLPELPKPLRYRFIGRSLALLDRDSALIIDFMKDALP